MGDPRAVVAAAVASPVFLTGVTCLVYAGAKFVYSRVRLVFLHPVLVSVAVLIAALRVLGVDYPTYRDGTSVISLLLGLSVVALAVPLHRYLAALMRDLAGIVTGVVFGGLSGVVAAVVPFLLLPGTRAFAVSNAPSSVTTPIAVAVSETAGGLPSLTAAVVIVTGVLGAMIGPAVLRLAGVRTPVAFGLALGTAAHGIGTARAFEEGELEGAGAGLGLCLNGVFTAAVMPLALAILLG